MMTDDFNAALCAYCDKLTKREQTYSGSADVPFHSSLTDVVKSAQTCRLCKAICLMIKQHSESSLMMPGQNSNIRLRSLGWTPGYEIDVEPHDQDARQDLIWYQPAELSVLPNSHPWVPKLVSEKDPPDVVGVLDGSAEDKGALSGTCDTDLCDSSSSMQLDLHQNGQGPIHTSAELFQKITINYIATQIQDCIDNHHKCSTDATRTLPTRVLDVKDSLVRIVSGEETFAPYAALSYCWGTEDFLRYTKATKTDLHTGLVVDRLPKCFQDAIVLTRALGLRYIWIDALCIIQDDAEDWAREASRMADVYSNAHVVLAASSSKAPSEGLLRTRPEAWQLVSVPKSDATSIDSVVYVHPPFEYTLKYPRSRQPLHKRGWALQEEYLSTRYVDFWEEYVIFECKTTRITSYGSQDIPYHTIPDDRWDLDSWYRLAGDFSTRSLTKQSDLFPALSGLANEFSHRIGGNYAAGIWENFFITQLAWSKPLSRHDNAPASVPTEYIAPSWSWALCSGEVTFGINPEYCQEIAKLERTCVHRTTADQFGKISHAEATICGPFVQLSLRHDGTRPDLTEVRTNTRVVWSAVDSKRYWSFYWDKVYDHLAGRVIPDGLESQELYAICLVKETYVASWLVIERVPDKIDTYVRLGLMRESFIQNRPREPIAVDISHKKITLI